MRTGWLLALMLTAGMCLAAPAGKGAGGRGPQRQVRITVRPQADADALDSKAFMATVDKGPARIVRVLTPADPQMILIVLDLVGDLGAIEPAKDALIGEIGKLPPKTYVGLLRAQDGLTVLLDPTNNRAAAADAIRTLTISGRPGLLDTLDPVERLADAIARKSQVRVSILYVTDSNVAEYREDFSNPVINSSDPHDLSRKFPEALIQEKISKIQTTMAPHQTPLHIVHLTYRSNRLNEAYQNGLGQIAAQMAGTSAFCRTPSDIPDAIQRAFHAIVSEYTLIVAVPEHSSSAPVIQIAASAPVVYRARMMLKEKSP